MIEPIEKAEAFYQDLLHADAPVEKNILKLADQKKDAMRQMQISMHIGTKDMLYCDNEIFRVHLEKPGILFEYKTFDGAEHRLDAIYKAAYTQTAWLKPRRLLI